MSETLESLRRKIGGAGELQAVVRTMKALAAANIGQYEKAVIALSGYFHAVELGLAVGLQAPPLNHAAAENRPATESEVAIVFGSDQGLVGQFNEAVTDLVVRTMAAASGPKTTWTVGERVGARLEDAGLAPAILLPVPNSVAAITPLVTRLLVESETRREKGELARIRLFHNRPLAGAIYEPVCRRLLPLDEQWRGEFAAKRWPTSNRPEALGTREETLLALVREYLFVSLYRACAESLAAENASRLAAMQRAERNIDDLLADLGRTFHRLRQNSIDEELFDVVSGYEAMAGDGAGPS